MTTTTKGMQPGTKVWTAISFWHLKCFLPVLKAIGRDMGHPSMRPFLLPLEFVETSGNGWRRYVHAPTGIVVVAGGGSRSAMCASKIEAVYSELQRVAMSFADRHNWWWYTRFKDRKNGENSFAAYERWTFEVLRGLYALYEEAVACDVAPSDVRLMTTADASADATPKGTTDAT